MKYFVASLIIFVLSGISIVKAQQPQQITDCGILDVKLFLKSDQMDAIDACMKERFSKCLPARTQWKMEGILEADGGGTVIKQFEILGKQTDSCQVKISYPVHTSNPDFEPLSMICKWDETKEFPQEADNSDICNGALMDAYNKKYNAIADAFSSEEGEAALADKIKGMIFTFIFSPESLQKITKQNKTEMINGELTMYFNPQTLKKTVITGLTSVKSITKTVSFKDLQKIKLADMNLASGGKDSDKDGISDVVEKSLHTHAFRKDSDRDGHVDKTEILSGYNPNNNKNKTRLYPAGKASNVYNGYFLLQKDTKMIWYANPSDGARYVIPDSKSFLNLLGHVAIKQPESKRDSLYDSLIAWSRREELAVARNNSRNSKRKADVRIILNAVYQYTIDKNELPKTIPLKNTEICKTGAASCAGLVDLSILTDKQLYLVQIPVDPNISSGNGSGYFIVKTAQGRISVTAPLAEQGESVSITR